MCWAVLASIFTAIAMVLWQTRRSHGVAGRLRALNHRQRCASRSLQNPRFEQVCADWNPSATLLLQLIAAVIAQGASIPNALHMIGQSCGGEVGDSLCHAGAALLRGVTWREAWAAVDGAQPLELIARTLRASWEDGVSPLPQIDAAIEQLDASERATIEQHASKLSVKLLLPMGLCMLPAFLFIAVIPTIMSFAQT